MVLFRGDDDIDIYMIRPDYQILMKVLSDELPEGYYNSSSYSDSTHMQPLTISYEYQIHNY